MARIPMSRLIPMARNLGCTIRRVSGEYRVNRKGAPEAVAYYTNDSADALATMEAIKRGTDAIDAAVTAVQSPAPELVPEGSKVPAVAVNSGGGELNPVDPFGETARANAHPKNCDCDFCSERDPLELENEEREAGEWAELGADF